MNRVYATITAVDTPAPKYYLARTCFGREFTAVSLRGIKHPLTVGQRCAVFEIGGALSAVDDAGAYPAILSVPDELREGFCREAKARAALCMLAFLAGNVDYKYSLATVTAASNSTLTVSGDKVSGQIGVLGLTAADFVVGDRVVVYHDHKPPVIIGWWSVPQTWKPSVFALYLSFKFGTIRPSLNKFHIDETGGITVFSEITFSPTLPESAMVFHNRQISTTDASPYLYSIETFTKGFSPWEVTEIHYLRWHKDMSQVESIDFGDYPPDPTNSYSSTIDGKFWWPGALGEPCKQSDTEFGVRYAVWPGVGDNYGLWYPAKGQVYAAL